MASGQFANKISPIDLESFASVKFQLWPLLQGQVVSTYNKGHTLPVLLVQEGIIVCEVFASVKFDLSPLLCVLQPQNVKITHRKSCLANCLQF